MRTRYLSESDAWLRIATAYERYNQRDRYGVAEFGLCLAVTHLHRGHRITEETRDAMRERMKSVFRAGSGRFVWPIWADADKTRFPRVAACVLLSILCREQP